MTTETLVNNAVHETFVRNYVPAKSEAYVPWGHYDKVKKIIQSKIFFSTYITGLSGNGKTMGIMQACAELGRECIRVNITCETDEDDLLGGFRLVNGDTVWQDGPVVEAMKRGAVLLLDEIDLASSKIMCLQPILEGNGVYLKKINEQVYHKPGFTVFATANTKGKGSENGQFMGTNVMNEAFLDRFPVTLFQDYPPADIERKILELAGEGTLTSLGVSESSFTEDELQTFILEIDSIITNAIEWAAYIRKCYDNGSDGVESVITTRRLVDFIRAYMIFRNEKEALAMVLERFDEEQRKSFMEFYEVSAKRASTTKKKQNKQKII